MIFISKIVDLTGQKVGHLQLLERIPQYKNNKTYYRCLCDCGKEYYVAHDQLRRNSTHVSCGCMSGEYSRFGRRKNYVGEKKNKLTVLEMLYEYGDNKATYMRCRCDCGNECIVSASSWKTGNTKSCGCQKVYASTVGNRVDYTGQRFGKVVVLEIDWDSKPTMAKCLCDCGKVFWTRKSHLVTGHVKSCGCSHFSRTPKNDYTYQVSEAGVVLLRPACHHPTKSYWLWECLCPECGREFIAKPSSVLSLETTSCGCKKRSTGETHIDACLRMLGVRYSTQVSFNDCRDRLPLPFDFAIYNRDGSLNALIEYDGEQHVRSVAKFGGDEGLTIRQAHDAIKTEYCNLKNIPLLRFSYKQSLKEITKSINLYCKSVETVMPVQVTEEASSLNQSNLMEDSVRPHAIIGI